MLGGYFCKINVVFTVIRVDVNLFLILFYYISQRRNSSILHIDQNYSTKTTIVCFSNQRNKVFSIKNGAAPKELHQFLGRVLATAATTASTNTIVIAATAAAAVIAAAATQNDDQNNDP